MSMVQVRFTWRFYSAHAASSHGCVFVKLIHGRQYVMNPGAAFFFCSSTMLPKSLILARSSMCAAEGAVMFLGYETCVGDVAAMQSYVEPTRIPLIFDLDQTLLVAYSGKQLRELRERLEDSWCDCARCFASSSCYECIA